MTDLRIRCSELPRTRKCAESIRDTPDLVPLSISGQPADLGKAVHEYARHIDAPTRPDLDELADTYDVPIDELEIAVALMLRAWRLEVDGHSLSSIFADSATEVALSYTEPFEIPGTPFESITLTGTADRLAVDGSLAKLLDWKSGRKDTNVSDQLKGYGFLAVIDRPDVDRVYSTTVRQALGYWEPTTYTRAGLLQWWEELKLGLRNGYGKFSPGDHCLGCRRFGSCDGPIAYTQRAIEVLERPAPVITPANVGELGPLIAEDIRSIRWFMGRGKEYISGVREIIRAIGPIPAGDGRQVAIRVEEKRALSKIAARPVLAEHCTDDEIAFATAISVSKLEKQLRARTPDGEKKHAVAKFRQDLDAVGAIRTSETEKVVEMKAPKPPKQESEK